MRNELQNWRKNQEEEIINLTLLPETQEQEKRNKTKVVEVIKEKENIVIVEKKIYSNF